MLSILRITFGVLMIVSGVTILCDLSISILKTMWAVWLFIVGLYLVLLP